VTAGIAGTLETRHKIVNNCDEICPGRVTHASIRLSRERLGSSQSAAIQVRVTSIIVSTCSPTRENAHPQLERNTQAQPGLLGP
jgi:hypothetical protein